MCYGWILGFRGQNLSKQNVFFHTNAPPTADIQGPWHAIKTQHFYGTLEDLCTVIRRKHLSTITKSVTALHDNVHPDVMCTTQNKPEGAVSSFKQPRPVTMWFSCCQLIKRAVDSHQISSQDQGHSGTVALTQQQPRNFFMEGFHWLVYHRDAYLDFHGDHL